MTMLALLGGLGLGIGLSRFVDPVSGRRRRALARDKVVSAAHAAGDAVDTTSRDLMNRGRGVVAGIRSRLRREPVSDAVVAERVRARIGGLVSHPRSIEVAVTDGRVTLRGPILADEVDRLVRRVAAVSGVRGVESQLDVHETPGDVPGLQGAPARRRAGARFELLQTQWSPTARLLTGIAGAGLALGGLRRRGLTGPAMTGAGLLLATRAATNLEISRLLGIGAGRRALMLQKTIDVAAPLEEVFEFWSGYENFPRFMSHVREVIRMGDDRSRWTVRGPGGVPITWDTVVTACEPHRLLAWKTLDGSPVAHAGVVRFEPNADGSTRIDIKMSYNPPGGALGHGVAALLGSDPKRAMDDDLVRLKSLLEEGQTRAHGQRVTREELA